MLLFAFLLGQALGLPEVEDPIPDAINFWFPFGLSGACGVLAGILYFPSPAPKREKAARWGILIGFCIGSVIYFLLLVIQLSSES
jgi:hypothetical protein